LGNGFVFGKYYVEKSLGNTPLFSNFIAEFFKPFRLRIGINWSPLPICRARFEIQIPSEFL